MFLFWLVYWGVVTNHGDDGLIVGTIFGYPTPTVVVRDAGCYLSVDLHVCP